MRILLVKLSALGDVVHTLPVLHALKEGGHEVYWVVEEPAAALLKGHPLLDGLFVSKRKTWLTTWRTERGKVFREIRSLVTSLRAFSFDLVLDLQGLLKSALLVGLSRARLKIGFANHREGSSLFYNFLLPPYDPDEHAVERYLKALIPLGLLVKEPCFSLPPLPQGVEQRFGLDGPYVVLVPCARWESKYWIKRFWPSLARRLREAGLKPVFVGSSQDRAYVRDLLIEGALCLCGALSLLELAALFQGAQAVISVDTGPMHLAVASGARVLALFGPTAPWRTGPYGPNHQVLFKGLPCSPCFRRRCSSRACMEAISPEEVFWTFKTWRTHSKD